MKTPKKWFVLWLTWFSSAGKTSIADALNEKLKNNNYTQIQRLDWDIFRNTLSKDLWFSKEDRTKNIERVAYVAELLSNHNIGVIASFISPYKSNRDFVKNQVKDYIEVFIDTDIATCKLRDIKWLYERAERWEIQFFTWVSDTYEVPQSPQIHIDTLQLSIEESSEVIYTYLLENWYL